MIDRFGPGVEHLNYLAVPGEGIFEFLTTNHFLEWGISVIFDLTFLPGVGNLIAILGKMSKSCPMPRLPPPPPCRLDIDRCLMCFKPVLIMHQSIPAVPIPPPPRANGGHLLTLSVLGVGHSQFYRGHGGWALVYPRTNPGHLTQVSKLRHLGRKRKRTNKNDIRVKNLPTVC